MSAEIDMSNGKANIAFVGSRDLIWHGLGQSLDKNATIDEWKTAAGLDWIIEESPVKFLDVDGIENTVEDRKVVYRSDTKKALGIVGTKFKSIQPGEILEFFRDIVSDTGIYIDTAGVLFEGRKIWASAYTNNSLILPNGDKITGNLLLTTGTDGTASTQASFVSTRVVCNNTLRVALAESSDYRVRVTHRQEFNPVDVKSQLGILDTSWLRFHEQVLALTKQKITDKDAYKLIEDFYVENKADMSNSEVKKVDEVFALYGGRGMGADLAYGNLWGVLNSITQDIDYGSRASATSKVFNSLWGNGAKQKQEAFEKLVEMSI
jgi:phage/plasmid-like protein (TIGR03299 family)